MSILDEMFAAKERADDRLRRNHEDFEIDAEYQRILAEKQVQMNAYEFIQLAIRETDNIEDIL